MTHAPDLPSHAGEPETERRAAIAFVLDAFDAAHKAGIGRSALSRAALFQAIMQIVDELGEEGAARFLQTSATGVERGYYSRDLSPSQLN
ncbi:MAG: hypothetical protein AAF739_00175 [Pseudomonadota bacterium]